jgi:hypothetical protein
VFGHTPSSRDTSSFRLPSEVSENDLATLDQAGFFGTAAGKVHQFTSLLATPQLVCEPKLSYKYRSSTQLNTRFSNSHHSGVVNCRITDLHLAGAYLSRQADNHDSILVEFQSPQRTRNRSHDFHPTKTMKHLYCKAQSSCFRPATADRARRTAISCGPRREMSPCRLLPLDDQANKFVRFLESPHPILQNAGVGLDIFGEGPESFRKAWEARVKEPRSMGSSRISPRKCIGQRRISPHSPDEAPILRALATIVG